MSALTDLAIGAAPALLLLLGKGGSRNPTGESGASALAATSARVHRRCLPGRRAMDAEEPVLRS